MIRACLRERTDDMAWHDIARRRITSSHHVATRRHAAPCAPFRRAARHGAAALSRRAWSAEPAPAAGSSSPPRTCRRRRRSFLRRGRTFQSELNAQRNHGSIRIACMKRVRTNCFQRIPLRRELRHSPWITVPSCFVLACLSCFTPALAVACMQRGERCMHVRYCNAQGKPKLLMQALL